MNLKKIAGDRAAQLVEHGMTIGLGTGSTVFHLVNALGERVAQGLQIRAVATSVATEEQARACGIPLLSIDEVERLDLAIDGVDEINPQSFAVKGGGGALYREKVVASLADEVVWIMDESKQVAQLGAFPLAVELARYGAMQTLRRLEALSFHPVLRMKEGVPYLTDNGGLIADLHLPLGYDAKAVAATLDTTLGVLEHGLFLGFCHQCIVGCSDGKAHVMTIPHTS